MKTQYSLEDPHESIRLRQAWEQVLKRIKPELQSGQFERFIKSLKPQNLVGDRVALAAPGKFVSEWVKERHLYTLEELLSDELGALISIDLVAEAREKPVQEPVEASTLVQAGTPDTAKFKPVPKFTFESFVVGQSNRLAFAGAKAVAQEPGQKFNPLFIYGQSGLGKTHLMNAIAHEVFARDPNFPLVYITAQRFAEEFVNSLQSNRTDVFRRAQRNVGMWLVDDIQFIAGKDKTSEEIFHTFNHLQSLGKQIVLCSDRPPRDLYLMDERLRSRFESGLVADIQLPDTETRCAILLSKAALENIELSHDLAMFLAESVPGNIRVLEGALTRISTQASVLNVPFSMEFAAEMVEHYYRAGTLAKPSVEAIVAAVGKHFKIDLREIHGTSRKAPIVHARHISVFITREITGDSWKHIGSLFGDRDHTSMMHGYQKIADMMQQDKDLRATVKMLMRNLYPDS